MRPEQSRLPRRSNWSNPKTCNYFAAFFPFREWAHSDGGSAFGFNADDFAMLAAPSCLIAPANSSRAFSRYSPERIRDALLSFGRFRHCLRDIPPQRPHGDSNTDKRWGLTVAEAGRVLSVIMRPVVQEPRSVDRKHGAFFLQGQIVRWSGLADVST